MGRSYPPVNVTLPVPDTEPAAIHMNSPDGIPNGYYLTADGYWHPSTDPRLRGGIPTEDKWVPVSQSGPTGLDIAKARTEALMWLNLAEDYIQVNNLPAAKGRIRYADICLNKLLPKEEAPVVDSSRMPRWYQYDNQTDPTKGPLWERLSTS